MYIAYHMIMHINDYIRAELPLASACTLYYVFQAKLELELEIVSEEEAELRPAGKARDDPNMNPKLDPPNRPATSFFWLTSPWKTFRFIIWKNYKWHIILVILVILIIILIILFIYTAPVSPYSEYEGCDHVMLDVCNHLATKNIGYGMTVGDHA